MLNNIYSLGHTTGATLHRLVLHHPLPTLPSASYLLDQILSFPALYKAWWFNLLSSDPIHVLIETVLILSVLYMILSQRSKDWRVDLKEKLSEKEKEELLRDWRVNGRAPLVPKEESGGGGEGETVVGSGAVVLKVDGSRLVIRDSTDGEEREVTNFATHDFLGMSVADKGTRTAAADSSESSSSTQSNGQKQQQPESEVPDTPIAEEKAEEKETAKHRLSEDGENPLKKASRAALSTYGCGSCGPRGFYGTIDAHLTLEDAISKFTNTEGAIMYSDGASAASSTIAAFAKRGDLLVVDEGIYEALGTGVTLSRATVKWFRHNDMDDLRHVLERIRSTDIALRRKSSDQRRFIVAEGLYKNSGTVAPLADVVALKNEFNYRLILDESFSFGTLGKTGRGALELHGKEHMRDAEIVTISLENSLGSIGGVCVGNEEVVDHQRLSGAGYCFSASAPPFVASAAVAALERIQGQPELLVRLGENRKYLYEQLKGMKGVVPERLIITSDELSPIVFLQVATATDGKKRSAGGRTREEQITVLDSIARECLQNGVALISTGRHVVGHIHKVPPPAIRMTVSAAHTSEDIDDAVKVLGEAVLKVMSKPNYEN